MTYLPHWPIPSTFGNAKIDFETVFLRISEVLEKLGNPHQKLPKVIHVVGTNGKGSTCSFLKEILQQNGYKVDLYTSPHIHNCNERILLDGLEISDSYLYEILEEVRIAAQKTPLTFFEAFTIAAFLAFSRSNSDFCILEAGMGARIDATNIIEKKEAVIITPISYDHEEYLGDSIAKIAYEKAFAMRKNTNLIMAPQPQKAKQLIEIMARDQNAKMIRYGEEFQIQIDEETKEFDFATENILFENLPKISLNGEHQYINAASALACAVNLEGVKITQENIAKALKSTFWLSRIEEFSNSLTSNFSKESKFYIDGAHNTAGAFALKKWLLQQSEDDERENIKRKNFVIVGFSRDKCKANFLKQFKSDEIIAVRVDGEPYPEDPEKIKEIAKTQNIEVTAKDDLLDAFYFLAKNFKNENLRVIICGSLHLARDVRKFGC